MNKNKYAGAFTWLVVAGAVAAVFYLFIFSSVSAPENDLAEFAICLKDRGAVFYGAFWCSHCEAQKKEFGAAADSLPYIECSTPDGNGQTAECRAKNITGYPTWEFADGSRESGELALETLAEKTGCVLP